MTQYENDCGADGRRQCRNSLIAYANSGALSEESKSELLYRIAHDGDIYGVAAD